MRSIEELQDLPTRAEARLTKADVDGLITCKVGMGRGGIDVGVGSLLRSNPRYSATLDYDTGNF